MEPDREYTVPLGKGVALLMELESIGTPDKRAKRQVMATVNGQLRPIRVRDESIESEVPAAERADSSVPGHVAVPFSGAVTATVQAGDTVEAGQPVATIEAMKMEASINAPIAGTVERVAISGTMQLTGGDLVLVIQ